MKRRLSKKALVPVTSVLALLAAWLAVSLLRILHHRGCGCGGCSGDCAHCRTSCGKEDR